MNISVGCVVKSLNGRDEGKNFYVTQTEGEYAYLADGKGRRLEKPKKKKIKHLKVESDAASRVADKLRAGEKVSNNELRRALSQTGSVQGMEV